MNLVLNSSRNSSFSTLPDVVKSEYFAGSYRYSFQGQESDSEVKGEGNSVNYKFRMHDTRLGRFFAVDPLASKYPHNSPYAFSENMVLHMIELEGLEAAAIIVSGANTPDYIDINKGMNAGYSKVGGPAIQVVGLVVTCSGYVCSLIPSPQTQAASKVLIPTGSGIELLGTTITVGANLIDAEYESAFTEFILSTAGFGVGKIADKLYDAKKITDVDRNTTKLLTELETPLIQDWVTPKEKKSETPKYDNYKKLVNEVMSKNEKPKTNSKKETVNSSEKNKPNPVKILPSWMQKALK